MRLSKSQYIRGLQCDKSLWLYKHQPKRRTPVDAQTQALFDKGHTVGELAKNLFPGGIEIPFEYKKMADMAEQTLNLIRNGVDVIYEATFIRNGVVAMADILVRNGDGWDMYEVKASTSVKPYHFDDASVQWYVLSEFVLLQSAYIVHINNESVRGDKLDVTKPFVLADITQEVVEKQAQIAHNLDAMRAMLNGPMPKIDIGLHCTVPFKCDFYAHCNETTAS